MSDDAPTPPQLPGTGAPQSSTTPAAPASATAPASHSAPVSPNPVSPGTISQLGAALSDNNTPGQTPAAGEPGGPGNTSAPGGTPPEDESVLLSWLTPIGLIGLSFYNFAIRFVTMGIYHFWGKTEVRRRLWSGIRLNGEPLVYTGKGMELFLGFLIVFFLILMPLFLIPIILALVILGPTSPYVDLINIPIYIILFYLFGVAVYRAQRYRLSRTTWRGIRGQMTGSPWAYAWSAFWTGTLIPLTLGWILPWRVMHLQGRLTNEMRFGTQSFAFNGSSEPLYWRFAIMWFSTLAIYLVTLAIAGISVWPSLQELITTSQQGAQPSPESIVYLVAMLYGALIVAAFFYAIISAWYRARMMNHFASCTKFSGLQFVGTLQARGLIYIAVTNFFIRLAGSLLFLIPGVLLAALAYYALVGMTPPLDAGIDAEQWEKITQGLTVVIGAFVLVIALIGFGLFAPVTSARRTGYLISRIAIDGSAPLHAIGQGAKQDITTGEGLAEAFDIDAF